MAVRLLFSFLILLVGSHEAFASVEETCAKAMEGSEHKNLESFCVTTLQAAPGSASADMKGLAVIATNLTLANYTAAVITIEELQRRGGWSADQQAALNTCRWRYVEAQNVVHSAIHALATGQKQAYVAEMGVVRRSPTDCDNAFHDGDAAAKQEEAPLHKVNDDARNLTTMAILIVMML